MAPYARKNFERYILIYIFNPSPGHVNRQTKNAYFLSFSSNVVHENSQQMLLE